MARRRNPSTRPPREPFPRGFMVIWTTVVIDMIGFGIAIPVLGPFARTTFGASGLMVGAIGSAFSLAQFVVAPFLGRLSDRIGRKPVIVVSLFGTAIASLVTGLAGSVWVLFAARAFDGASGATIGVAQAAVSDIVGPRRRAQALGMIGAAFGVGFTVGPALGALAAWIGDRRTPFYVAAALAAANAVAAIVRIPETKGTRLVEEAEAARTGAGLARTWRENDLPTLIVVSAVSMFAFSAFEQTFSIFGQDRIGFTESTAGIAFVVVGVVVSVVQGGLVGPAVRSMGDGRLLLVGLALTAVGLGVLSLTRGWWLLVPALVLLSAGQGFASPTMSSSLANRIDPARRGEVLGVSQSWGSLARVLGPLAGGVAFDHVGVPAPFVGGAVLFGVCLLLLLRVRPPGNSGARSSEVDENRAFARS